MKIITSDIRLLFDSDNLMSHVTFDLETNYKTLCILHEALLLRMGTMRNFGVIL